MSITATELEVLGCLGSEPELLDRGVTWRYNEATYRVEVDGLLVTLVLAPSYSDVRLTVHRGEQRLYELDARDVADVRVIDEPGRDALEVEISDELSLRMRLRPTFEITQGYTTAARTPWA